MKQIILIVLIAGLVGTQSYAHLSEIQEAESEISDGLNEGFLPVPSVFVVNSAGQIGFEYINPDYKTRLSASLLIAVLKNLN